MEFEDLIRRLGGELIDLNKHVKTVAQAVKAIGVKPKQIIKSMLFITGKGPIIVIVDGESKVDVEKLGQLYGGARLASPKEVIEITGYEVGALPPVGVNIKTVVDKQVMENKAVFGGGGSVTRLLKLDPRKIVDYQKADIMDIRKV